MKAIFSSLKLDGGKPSLPQSMDKGKGPATEVAVASSPGMANLTRGGIVEGDTYALGFDDG